MQTSDFDYYLPPELIAQTPIEPRDAARMLVINRADDSLAHCHFHDVGSFLTEQDVLVFNRTRVIPARLLGRKQETGGKVEVLLLRREGKRTWRALVGGRRIQKGTRLEFSRDGSTELKAEVVGEGHRSERILKFEQPPGPLLESLGQIPLPPYIHSQLEDPERYQTVYARDAGSAAAPTAGLHFTPELLTALKQQGVKMACCTLHIGMDTFQPVQVENLKEHVIHTEHAMLSAQHVRIINKAKLAGGRVVAVGTTAVRVLESAAIKSESLTGSQQPVVAMDEDASLYIYPGYRYRVVDALITNFHLPRSTLLMLVSAFAGMDTIRHAYQMAIEERYRFYSFGDACLIV